MCGIAGILYAEKAVQIADLHQMTTAIAHRGPDGAGHWQSGRIALGHRRLSIIDLSEKGSQPMHYAAGRYTITFNGEIYNYKELRRQLTDRGHRFVSNTDTEVLLALYAEKGAACLSQLDGMFAFAIWDSHRQTLFCARDRFGEKPFYYSFQPGQHFIFGSEMKALWAYGIPKRIKRMRLYHYMAANYISHPTDASDTFLENISKLPAAHYLLVKADLSIEQQCYWQIPPESIGSSRLSFDDSCHQFRELFTRSIQLRLQADVPVGSSLSGGLDSSAVVCLINHLNSGKQFTQKTFSARFPNHPKDEGFFMHEVIRATSVEPHFVYPDYRQLLEQWPKVVHHQEEPVGSASIFAQWCVMQLVKEQNVTVLLDGQGADEQLAGYHYYYSSYWNELAATNPTLYAQEKNAFQQVHFPPKPPKSFFQRYTYGYVLYRLKQLFGIPTAAAPHQAQSLIHPGLLADYAGQSLMPPSELAHHTSTLNNYLYYNTFHYGLEDLLRYADRNSMAHSREVRLPFLSHQLVEFSFSLPAHYKIQNGWTKYLQRKALADIMPDSITWRTDKIGYEPPQQSWLTAKPIAEKMRYYQNYLAQNEIICPKHRAVPEDFWSIFMMGSFLTGE
jgi:asparagine synthase (glutamine-hydrolysing)